MRPWPHAPLHVFNDVGTYMVTGATLNKEPYFKESQDLDYLHDLLLELAEKYDWKLEAWALFSNHYHFMAQSPKDPKTLKKFITHFHASSARYLNDVHHAVGRKVWYQFWDSQITYQRSYLARLNYVMQNPVKHKLVHCATDYKWCSAAWFEREANKSHYDTVISMKTDSVEVIDDF